MGIDNEFIRSDYELRYPADTMVQLNEQIIRSIKNAGFDFLS